MRWNQPYYIPKRHDYNTESREVALREVVPYGVLVNSVIDLAIGRAMRAVRARGMDVASITIHPASDAEATGGDAGKLVGLVEVEAVPASLDNLARPAT